MNRPRIALGFFVAFTAAVAGCGKPHERTLLLATTTSVQDTGLLDALLPEFTRKTGITVKPVARGSGEALRMAQRGDVDAVLVHAPAAEQALVDQGLLIERHTFMHNHYVLLGPDSDPADVRKCSTAAAAFAAIAKSGAVFVSRGDKSGTHQAELNVWKSADTQPAGAWYLSTGGGMGQTLRVADEKRGYCLSDRGTYLSQAKTLSLKPLFGKGAELYNPYSVARVNPAKHAAGNHAEAAAFVEFLKTADAERIVRDFGRSAYGEALFVWGEGK